VLVEPDLSLPGHHDVYVVGDLALVMQDGKPVPGVAQGALQGGRHAASCVVASLSGRPPTPFHYRDKGMLAAIGRAAAVADLPKGQLTGFPAWLVWAGVHIYFLIGFRNRVFVMAHWSWAFLTHDRGARLITGSPALRSRWEKPRT
jgi:NADH dehydrogenase